MTQRPRIVIWADADQEPMVRRALDTAQLELAAVGSESRDGLASLGKSFNVERVEDVRQAILHDSAQILWLAAPDTIDVTARRLLAERTQLTVISHPQVQTIGDLTLPGGHIEGLEFAPRMVRSPGFRATLDALPQFGEAGCVSVFCRSGIGQGTLFARLFDAMDVIVRLCGQPETINAALSYPMPGAPESLADLRGHMTVNLRYKSNRCACLALSDAAGSWFRGVTILGSGGCLRVSDSGFEWTGADGRLIDEHKGRGPLEPGELVGIQIRRRLDELEIDKAPTDDLALLALCEAARLSCLTGQEEAPDKLVAMLNRP